MSALNERSEASHLQKTNYRTESLSLSDKLWMGRDLRKA